jgi:hypothetical protein
MRTFTSNYLINDHLISEKDKETFEYLSAKIDYYIMRLVGLKNNEHIRKCRDLYEGHRDPKEYAYLQEQYGLETPMDLRMTPLTKTKIDTLIGILLDSTYKYYVTCADSRSIEASVEQQRMIVMQACLQEHEKFLKQNYSVEKLQHEIVKIKADISEDFISSFVEAAIDLVEFFKFDNATDLLQKFKQFALDVLVTGHGYYRTFDDPFRQDPQLQIIKPENLFYNKNTNEQYINNSPSIDAVVHREYMTRRQVLSTYGHLMTTDQRDELFGTGTVNLASGRVILSLDELDYNKTENQRTGSQFTFDLYDAIEVCHVEFLASNPVEDLTDEQRETFKAVENPIRFTSGATSNGYITNINKPLKEIKVLYREQRYEGIRIAGYIYVGMGKSKYVERSQDEFWRAGFSYGGLSYNSRNGKAYSLAWALKDTQDMYDITMFHRDNIIANSGVDGSRVNMAAIPKFLGSEPMQRLLKFLAMRKQGVELIDPTEEGADLFQHYGDFRNSLNGQAIQALDTVLESLEKQADILTGVNRFMYGALEERDAVQNVRSGIKQSSLVTKDLLDLIKHGKMQMLHGLLKVAKHKYKTAKRGGYIIGFRQKLFQVLPDDYQHTDYNIQLVDDDEIRIKLAKIEALLSEFAKAQLVDPEILLELTVSDSINNIIRIAKKSIRESREKAQNLQQANDQLKQMDLKIKELESSIAQKQQQADQFRQKEVQIKEKELLLKQQQLKVDTTAKEKELSNEVVKINQDAATDQERLALEREQLYLSTGASKEIRNDW